MTSPRGALRVLVADDFPLIRLALGEELGAGGFEVCGEAADAMGALRAARRERPDLCLLDVNMPGNGIAAAAAILAELPQTKIVMLTAAPSDAGAFASLRAGAVGYLGKDVDQARLQTILLNVAAGEMAFPRALTRPLVESYLNAQAHVRHIPAA